METFRSHRPCSSNSWMHACFHTLIYLRAHSVYVMRPYPLPPSPHTYTCMHAMQVMMESLAKRGSALRAIGTAKDIAAMRARFLRAGFPRVSVCLRMSVCGSLRAAWACILPTWCVRVASTCAFQQKFAEMMGCGVPGPRCHDCSRALRAGVGEELACLVRGHG